MYQLKNLTSNTVAHSSGFLRILGMLRPIPSGRDPVSGVLYLDLFEQPEKIKSTSLLTTPNAEHRTKF